MRHSFKNFIYHYTLSVVSFSPDNNLHLQNVLDKTSKKNYIVVKPFVSDIKIKSDEEIMIMIIAKRLILGKMNVFPTSYKYVYRLKKDSVSERESIVLCMYLWKVTHMKIKSLLEDLRSYTGHVMVTCILN